ncbi:MAG TPA: hypothetical protein VFW15_03290 [Thermoanaerobaculia bacterium]|nr:hypothetical protein [Thermoanaerobaculia bacterium]
MRISRRALSGVLLLLAVPVPPANGEPADEVRVPGGAEAVRRLLGLDPSRPRESFFLEVHQTLLAGAEWSATWSQIERRRALVDFVDDLADWRREFGRSVALSFSSRESLRRTRDVLEWLGFNAKERGGEIVTESRDAARSVRRQNFFQAVALPAPVLMSKLRAGESVVVAPADGTAPLPFGLSAWRELLGNPRLSDGDVFLELVKNVGGSRLLVTLHALDSETRDGLRALARSGKGSVLFDEDVLDRLARFPGALALWGGQLVLPGGHGAGPLWADVFGVAPARTAAFIRALFHKDAGRGAYTVEVFQQLPDRLARALLFGGSADGDRPVARIRKLYRAIERTRESVELSRRDPYDFAHLARFLRVGPDGEIVLPPLDLDGETFPRDETELAEIVSRSAGKGTPPEDALVRLVRGEDGGGADAARSARRFIVVSSLLDGRPELQDPGVVALLLRGADRFGAAYALFEDVPFQEPALARRYLFTLDRLDRRRPSRGSEVVAALFQSAAQLTATAYRAGSLDVKETREVFGALLDQHLFLRPDGEPAKGEADLFAWISTRLLPALDAGERRALARNPAPDDPDAAAEDSSASADASSMDERLTRALVGFPPPAIFEWAGGHYRFDPASDEVSRRREFRGKQRAASLEDLAAIQAARETLVGAAARGDASEVRAGVAILLDRLELSAESAGVGPRDDERILDEYERARNALDRAAEVSGPVTRAKFEADLADVDTVIAERLLEALLVHVYAAAAGDPDDLYFEDPDFVRRHSFRTVEKGGRRVEWAFSPTALTSEVTGGGSRVSGSLFGLPDVLGLLHADQITYAPSASITNESIRSGLVGSVRRVSAARMDDDALVFVTASCRAAEELATALAASERGERFRIWRELAKDLVPRSRLASLAELGQNDVSPASLARFLSPSDLYRIGARLARGGAPESVAPPESAAAAKEALARLVARHGAVAARERIAEFGPRAVAFAGRLHLTDLDLPSYESLAAYRTPQLFGDRLYDWKIVVARAVADAGLPAVIVPLVLPRAVDEMMRDLRMTFPYDWSSIVRRSSAFGAVDVSRLLEEELQAGRLLRDHARDTEAGSR